MTDMSDPPQQPAESPEMTWQPVQTAPGQPATPPPSQDPAYPAQSGQSGQPGWPMPPAAPPPKGTNGLAIAALILAFVFFPLGLILGIVALVQINKSGEKGRGLAIAAIVVSCLAVIAIAAAVVLAFLGGAERDDSGAVTGAGSIGAKDLRVGDCLADLEESEFVSSVDAVPCGQLHTGEVFAVFDLPEGGDYPGDEALLAEVNDECFKRIQTYAPRAIEDPELEPFFFTPTKSSWAFGDRTVACIALDATGRTGSIKQG